MAPDPGAVFLDTAYVNALINTRDQWHETAVNWERRLAAAGRQLVTIEFVLVEIADGLAAVRYRAQAAEVIASSERALGLKSSQPLLISSMLRWSCITVATTRTGG